MVSPDKEKLKHTSSVPSAVPDETFITGTCNMKRVLNAVTSSRYSHMLLFGAARQHRPISALSD